MINLTDSQKSARESHTRNYVLRPGTAAVQRRVLDEYIVTGALTHSCRKAGIDPKRHYEWLQFDPNYPDMFAEAHERSIENMEIEARRRAVDGTEEPVGWYHGVPGGYVKRYSDNLLIFMLKSARPDKYRERIEHMGKDGGPIEINNMIEIDSLPIEAKREMLEVLTRYGIEVGGSGGNAIDVTPRADVMMIEGGILEFAAWLPDTYEDDGDDDDMREGWIKWESS